MFVNHNTACTAPPPPINRRNSVTVLILLERCWVLNVSRCIGAQGVCIHCTLHAGDITLQVWSYLYGWNNVQSVRQCTLWHLRSPGGWGKQSRSATAAVSTKLEHNSNNKLIPWPSSQVSNGPRLCNGKLRYTSKLPANDIYTYHLLRVIRRIAAFDPPAKKGITCFKVYTSIMF